jgi:hypothetical protein
MSFKIVLLKIIYNYIHLMYIAKNEYSYLFVKNNNNMKSSHFIIFLLVLIISYITCLIQIKKSFTNYFRILC